MSKAFQGIAAIITLLSTCLMDIYIAYYIHTTEIILILTVKFLSLILAFYSQWPGTNNIDTDETE